MQTTARRVLVIGRIAEVNQRVVARLLGRGVAAVGASGDTPEAGIDAREFALIAIGSGVDPDSRAALKRGFRDQNPEVALLDAYGPVAAEQVVAALRQADGAPPRVDELAVEDAGEVLRVRVAVADVTALQLDVYRHRGSPEPEVIPVAAARVTAGAHTFAVARTFAAAGHMLVLRADDDEVHVRRLEDV